MKHFHEIEGMERWKNAIMQILLSEGAENLALHWSAWMFLRLIWTCLSAMGHIRPQAGWGDNRAISPPEIFKNNLKAPKPF